VKPLFLLVLLGGCAALPPAEVLSFTLPPSVLAGEEVQVSASVRGAGSVRIHVAAGSGELLGQDFPGEGSRSIEWSFRAPDPGTYAVVLGSGQTVRMALLEVKPASPRILLVERPPRFEYRFLKKALLRDASLRVHCLLTSADPDWSQEHTEGFDGVPSKFPVDLSGYEVVVLGDEMPPEHLVRFVREQGGGLVVIPGHLRWTGELDRLLPVSIEGEAAEGIEAVPRLTAAGRDFLPFDFSPDQRPLRWLVRSRPREGSQVLAEADGQPLFVIGRAGKGRVFWSATDETWLWRYRTGDEPYFYPLWRRAIAWAATGR